MLNMIKMYNIKLYIVLFLLASVSAIGQQKQVAVSIDSTRIKIGSQANLTIKTTVDTKAKVLFPKLKNIGQLEVLESYPVDTIENSGTYQLIKKYGVTQFNEGNYIIPPLTVTINGRTHKTDPLKLEVATVVVDTTKQKLYDIKDVASPGGGSNFWTYILVLLGFLLAGGLIYWDIKRKRLKAKPEIYIPPIDKASGGFKVLDHKQLLQKGDVKEYYSELANIVRVYIEEELNIPALENTTKGLLEALRIVAAQKKMVVPEEIFLQLEHMLQSADMVKFALSLPPDKQLKQDRDSAEQVVNMLHSSYLEATKDDRELSEAYRQEQLRKQQRRRRIIGIAACCTLALGVMAYFGFMKIYGSLQENVLGHPTEDLWKGEWVKSEYGNPAVTINTPRVLKRNPGTAIPKQGQNVIQSTELFEYGAMLGNFYIGVSTTKYQPGVNPDPTAALEVTIAALRAQGASNIFPRTETFENDEHQKGIRAFGSMSIPNALTKKPKRVQFEIIYFPQLQGLQQVVFIYDDQDENAVKIVEKVKKSIRFRGVL